MTQTDDFKLKEFLPYRFAAITERMSRAFAKSYAEKYDLSIAEWRVMATLLSAPSMKAKQVALQTPLDKVSVSRAVKTLDQRRLVERQDDPEDGRAQLLSLSKKGREVALEIAKMALAFENKIFGSWDEAARDKLLGALDQLEAIEDQNLF